jgi:3-hydroxybutyryl-CoA dehydrogenase
MGVGIAQVAAQAGHTVMLFDTREGAAAEAKDKLAKTLEGLVAKGKLSAEAARPRWRASSPVSALKPRRRTAWWWKPSSKTWTAKRSLFQQLEAIVAPDCVLATNTSSISVTAMANGLQHPGGWSACTSSTRCR